MFYNAKNHTVTIDGDTTDFISFGKGKKNLIIIPGVGDGLKTATIGFAISFTSFAKKTEGDTSPSFSSKSYSATFTTSRPLYLPQAGQSL